MFLLNPCQYVEALAESSPHNTTSWLEVLTLDLLPDSNYFFSFNAEAYINNAFRDGYAKIEENDVNTLLDLKIYSGGTAGAWRPFSGSFFHSTDSTPSPFIDLDVRMITTFGSDTIQTRYARLAAWKLST